MKVASFSVTCTSGSNSAELTGDICYMGVPRWTGPESTSAYGSYNYPRYALLNVVATKVSGGDFTATYSCYGDAGSHSYETGYEYAVPINSFNPRVRKSTNGANSVSWDGELESWVNFDYTVYGGRQTAMMGVYFVANWGDGDIGVNSSEVALTDPWPYNWYDRPENAMWLRLDGNGGQVATYTHSSGNTTPESLFGFIPSTTSPSITVTGNRPTRSDYSFAYWNTERDGSGTTYQRKSEWNGDHVDSENTMRLYAIWNPTIFFNANGGSGASIVIEKPFNQSIQLPSTVPTYTNKVFNGWNTQLNGSGTQYAAGGTVAASMNDTVTLYAQWREPTPPPTISSITVVRCNSSGTADDLGTYAKLTVKWSVSRTYDNSNTGLVTGYYRVSGSSSMTSFAFSSGSMGASGTATVTLSGFDTDTQYEFIAEVQDSNQDAWHTNVTERAVVLTRAKFIMDLKAGGEAMGLFSAAPSDGLEVGKDAQFDGNVTVLGNITANNLTLSSDTNTNVATAGTDFTLTAAYGYSFGPLRTVSATFTNANALTAGTQYTIGTLKTVYTPTRVMGFANQFGVGYVSGSTIYFKPLVSVNASTSIYVSLTHIKA